MHRTQHRFLLGFFAGALLASVLVVSSWGRGTWAAAPYADLGIFSDVLRLVRENYVEPVDEHKLIRGALRGMLLELDPHSSYLDPDAHKEMQIDTRGEFHGLGIEISKRRDGYIEVVSPIDGTPAWNVGIRARDQIVDICPTEVPEDWTEPCRGTKGMDLHEAVSLMRGRKGTKITIKIFREGFEKPEPYTIIRDVVKVVSVDGKLAEPGYAYVRVRSFQERTAEDLEYKLADLREENGREFDGLVLDLRDNPGGLLDQAVKVADIWLQEGLVVYTKGRVKSQQQEFRARPQGESGYPMVVLVNAGSASASEIVAGALQDQSRALVLGTPTFGKGSVQTVYPLDDRSGLRLTTALYYTPAGRSIQEVGIEPDIQVAQADAIGADPGAGLAIREKDLEGHFTQEEAAPQAESAPDPEAADDAAAADEDPSDLQLARAVEVLKSWTYFDRLRRARAGDPVRSARSNVTEEADGDVGSASP
jgi:carboxyl-terminal processing protease